MPYLRLLFLVFMMAVLLVSCSQTTPTPLATPTPPLSPQARAYLTAVLGIMQQHSVNRKKINWTTLRQQAFALADGAKTPADTYPAIESALELLGDHTASSLIRKQRSNWKRQRSPPMSNPMGNCWLTISATSSSLTFRDSSNKTKNNTHCSHKM